MNVSKKSPLEAISHTAVNTSDFFDLKNGNRRLFPIFIYDSLQIGKKSFSKYLGKDAIYYGKGKTSGQNFVCKNGFGTVDVEDPVAFVDNYRGPDVGSIEGDIFAVGLRTLCFLDYIYDNENMFNRNVHYIKAQEQDDLPINKRYIPCYMWVGDEDWFHGCYGELSQFKPTASYILNNNRTYTY